MQYRIYFQAVFVQFKGLGKPLGVLIFLQKAARIGFCRIPRHVSGLGEINSSEPKAWEPTKDSMALEGLLVAAIM